MMDISQVDDGATISQTNGSIEEIDLHSPSSIDQQQEQQEEIPQEVKKAIVSDDTPNTTHNGTRLIHINDVATNKTFRVPWVVKLSLPSVGIIQIPEVEVKIPFLKAALFANNEVSTTQYFWWNFIPVNFLFLNLLQQYKLVHNWYFLIVMIFSLIPGVSPTNPVSSVLPVLFILGVNMIKDGTEDLRRYLKDRQTNRKKIKVVRDGAVVEVSTGEIRVGEIVSLTSEDIIPADIVVLYSNNADNKCYVETAQLDGETNMKPKFGKSVTHYLESPELLKDFRGTIRCNGPDRELHKFDATLAFKNAKGEDVEEILGYDNLILKGCVLKNTATLYGVATYTGRESKIMLNTAQRQPKFSFIDIRVNLILAFLIIVHQLISILFVILSSIYQKQTALDSFYIEPDGREDSSNQVNAKYVVLNYLTFFILMNLLIPMSLFVSLQFIKRIQAYFMEQDLKMYYEVDDIRMEATASDLNADLSKIDIIFSDKTGTLTNNQMVFKKMGIGDKIVHDEVTQPGVIGERLRHILGKSVLESFSPKPSDKHIQFADDTQKKMPSALDNIGDDEELQQRTFMMHYMLNLLLDNELIVENGEYGGESPDEICLAKAAAQNGFVLLNQNDNQTEVEIDGRKHIFPKVYTIKFTPDRKRMSVIVQYPKSFLEQFPWFKPGGYDYRAHTNEPPPCVCYTKGADSFLYPLLKKGETDEEKREMEYLVQKSQEYLDDFGTEGLRTLLLCHRVVDARDADIWRKKYIKASGVAATQQIREQKMNKVAEEMEFNMDYDGATAIEDKLQEFVPETIRFILNAGIQFWVLTGDKRQTAKNVAQLASIVVVPVGKDDTRAATHIVDVELPSEPDPVPEQLRTLLKDAHENIKDAAKKGSEDICLVVNGTVIGCLENAKFKDALDEFVLLSKACKTVIVCRAIPAHKAAVVRLVEKTQKKRGLAIGDGANDVSMIQAATVGIGISGKEGSQARNAADYALPRFHHLKRLLAVHGHYSLTRSALFTQYSFYKNVVVTFVQFFYVFYGLYAGQTIIDSWVLTFYNMIFTLLPPFVMGLFEKDLDEKILEDNPHLYKETRDAKIGFGQGLTFGTFIIWFAQAIYHAGIIFFVCIYATTPQSFESMQSDGLWTVSVIVSINIFIVVNIKAALETSYFTIINHLCIWVSVFVFFAFIFAYGGIPVLSLFGTGTGAFYWEPYYLVSHYRFYMICALCIVLCMVPDFTIKTAKQAFFPAEWQIMRWEHEKEVKRQRKFGKKKKTEDEIDQLRYGDDQPQEIELQDEAIPK